MRIEKDELQRYVDARMSQRAIAQATGIPEPTIAWTMRRYGIESRLKPKPKESKETLERMYLNQGMSVMAIAKELGRSDSSILKWMKEYGIETRPRGTNQVGTPITTQEFKERIEKFGHKLKSEYLGWGHRVEYQCRCGRAASAYPAVLTRGGGCKECASERLGKSKRIPESTVKSEMEKNGDTYHSSYYEKGFCRVKYHCSSCGNDADVLWQNYRKGQKCGGCRVLQFSGENNHNWNPNLTDEEREELGRYDPGYKDWAKQVKRRDDYTCQCCKKRGGGLVSHHLESYVDNKHLRTDVANGVTLCENCHKEFHAAYGYGNNTRQQFIQFLSKRY